MRVTAYFDGFNFYYGAVRKTPCKWVNIKTVVENYISHGDVVTKVKYFSARVKPQPHDPDQPVRQQAYFRALKTLPEVEIILGYYLEKEKKEKLSLLNAPILNYLASKLHPSLTYCDRSLVFAKIVKREEKGSDVNLGVHLVHDAHLGNFDHALVVTGDSDLVEPVRLVTREIGLPVTVINPQNRNRPSAELKGVASAYHKLDKKLLPSCMFPPLMRDAVGQFHKPATW